MLPVYIRASINLTSVFFRAQILAAAEYKLVVPLVVEISAALVERLERSLMSISRGAAAVFAATFVPKINWWCNQVGSLLRGFEWIETDVADRAIGCVLCAVACCLA